MVNSKHADKCLNNSVFVQCTEQTTKIRKDLVVKKKLFFLDIVSCCDNFNCCHPRPKDKVSLSEKFMPLHN